MLLYPSINTLREKTDSRYSLVILTAKRARDIVDGKPALTELESERPVSQAAKEIAADMITFTRKEEEEKTAEAAEEKAEAAAAEEAAEEVQEEAKEEATEVTEEKKEGEDA